MDIFAFGLGYCAQRLLRRQPDLVGVGTVRTREAEARLAESGLPARLFDPAAPAPTLVSALTAARIVLVSAPPGPAGDPLLRNFAPELASSRSLKRVIYLSTVGVYGDWGGAWVDESSELRAKARRGLQRAAAEAEWLSFGERSGVAVDILRVAGIYGPGRNSLLKLREGDARRIIKPDQVFNRIHVDDIVQAIVRLIERDGPGGIWNLADDEPSPPQDVIAFAAGLLGLPPPPEEPFDGASLTEMSASFYAENKRVSNAKLKRELGVSLFYPTYREGLTALAAAGEGRSFG